MPTIDRSSMKPSSKAKPKGKPTPAAKKGGGDFYADLGAGRPVKFKELASRICAGKDALTVAQAKQLFGYTEDEEEAKEKGFTEPLFKLGGKSIWCINNTRNRPFTESWADSIAQDILSKNFAPEGPNGETIIIGRTGLVLSAQHRLAALIKAGHLWEGQPHWKEYWKTEPTIDSYMAFGVSENLNNVKTLDNVKPRSLSDVLVTSGMFSDFSRSDMLKANRVAEYAVRNLWDRVGMREDAFHVRQTHSESLEFIRNHEKLLDAVRFIFKENKEGKVAKFAPPGLATALLYLMGTSATDGDAYRGVDTPSEKQIDTAHWEKAMEFWTLLASNDPTFKRLRFLAREKGGESYIFAAGVEGGSTEERAAALVKGWNLFVNGDRLAEADLLMEYHTDSEGAVTLIEHPYPTTGGIDLGGRAAKRTEREHEAVNGENTDPEVSEEEVEERIQKTRNGKPLDEEDEGTQDDGTDEEVGEDEEEMVEEEMAEEEAPKVAGKKPGTKAKGAPVAAEPKTLEEEIEEIREQHPGKVILLKRGNSYSAYGKDAGTIAAVLRISIKSSSGTQLATFPEAKLEEYLVKLTENGHSIAVAETDEPPAPKANGKPAPKPKAKAGK